MIDRLIEKKIQTLPKNIRLAVEQFDWSTALVNITQKYHLQIDDVTALRNEIMLVVVGLSSASDFESNLVKQMGIPRDLAQQLVEASNNTIFAPLQKKAFTKKDDSLFEDEIIEHEEISSLMEKHGVVLVDEGARLNRPQNELQNLADSLFLEKEEEKEEYELVVEDKEEFLQETKQSPVNYQEPIEESDLRGVKQHTVQGEVVSTHSQIETQTPEFNTFKNSQFSQSEKYDFSPSKEEQVVENGDFLKHIGALPE